MLIMDALKFVFRESVDGGRICTVTSMYLVCVCALGACYLDVMSS